MTTWTGRPPISYTQTEYEDHITYDSTLFYSGVSINNTSWSARQIPYSLTVMTILESGYWDDTGVWSDTLLWSDTALYGTSWTARTIP